MFIPIINDGKRNVVEYSDKDWTTKLIDLISMAGTSTREEKARILIRVLSLCTTWLSVLGYDAVARDKLRHSLILAYYEKGYFQQFCDKVE